MRAGDGRERRGGGRDWNGSDVGIETGGLGEGKRQRRGWGGSGQVGAREGREGRELIVGVI